MFESSFRLAPTSHAGDDDDRYSAMISLSLSTPW